MMVWHKSERGRNIGAGRQAGTVSELMAPFSSVQFSLVQHGTLRGVAMCAADELSDWQLSSQRLLELGLCGRHGALLEGQSQKIDSH